MPQPKISVIMPVYNAQTTVIKALDSLQAQTFEPFEIIVVNDGSTDATAQLLENHSGITLINRPHRGIVPALNDALAASSGEYIARMDADDLCHPLRFEKQAALLDQNPEIGVAGCRVGFGGDKKEQAGYSMYVDWINGLISPEEIAVNRFVESPLAHPSVMFRRALVKQYGGYRNGPFPEDYELWLRWMSQGVRVGKVDEELLIWNDPPERLSRTDKRYSVDAFYRTKGEYLLKWLEENNPHHPDLIVWGAGRITRRRVDILAALGLNIVAYIDIKERQLTCGTPVLGPEEIPAPDTCFVLSMVGNRGAREDIGRFLRQRGFSEGRNCLFAA